MKKFIAKLIIFIVFIMGINCGYTYAASIPLSISKSSANVGDTFSVTISGINGRVSISGNSNITLSQSGNVWVDGSLTITGTAKSQGTGTVTVSAIDASTTAAEPVEVTGSTSRSIQITEKKVEQPSQQQTQVQPQNQQQPANTNQKSNNNNNNSNNSNTKKQETKKSNEDNKENKESEEQKEAEVKEEEKQENYYISKLIIKGINDEGKSQDIELSPEFNKDVFEYTCRVGKDIRRIDIEKEAGEYTNNIQIDGLGDLKDGENEIVLTLKAEGKEDKKYVVKVIKEKSDIEEISEKEDKTAKIIMPVWGFILMQLAIIIVEVVIIRFINKSKRKER